MTTCTPEQHGLMGLMRTTDPMRLNIVCLCGEIASGVDGARWIVQESAPGLYSATPSFNWPGHFHETATATIYLEYEQVFEKQVGASFDD